MRLVDELRNKYPGMSGRAAKGSRTAAIRLFCLECMGGAPSEVTRCEDDRCPLYMFRTGRKHRDKIHNDLVIDEDEDIGDDEEEADSDEV